MSLPSVAVVRLGEMDQARDSSLACVLLSGQVVWLQRLFIEKDTSSELVGRFNRNTEAFFLNETHSLCSVPQAK